ncbi:hypothetical protein [Kamptonema formosum]|uniref:hypothetical protein n=1 Tax=Kamptonema formosum TaxID=331992 RepID=UPI00034B697B|nr:hypothetical protein [Oscillatoria sp. PCC 10802]
MSFAIFDEAFYLKSYPDVEAAVKAGAFQSGLEHFQKFGLRERRVLVSPLYDERFYLQKNPDVAAAVAAGGFSSGLEHYILFGEAEGRAPSSLFDLGWYLRRYPDVAAAVAAGDFSSGLDHYRLFGEAEGRSGTTFNEFGYREANPDVAAAIAAGAFKSGLEHYSKFGQFENRTGVYFSGTSGNDTVTGFGNQDTLCGVDLSPGSCVIGGTPTGGECLDFRSLGVSEADVLIGGSGNDTFVLGSIANSRVYTPLSFYTGAGDADFAMIENFAVGKDRIQLAGFDISDYLFQTSEGNVNIYYAFNGGFGAAPSPDLVAVVRGVTSLSESDGSIYLV